MATWDEETDLVVVGSGAAGLTAAVVADREGLEVIVLEKEAVYGGSTARSGGVAWIPNNHVMAKEGISDSPEDALTYLKHNIGNRVAAAKLEAFVEHAPRMAAYIASNSELEFNLVHGFPDYRPETPGGSEGGRSIDPKVVSGRRLNDLDRLAYTNVRLPGGLVGSVTEMRRLAFFRSAPFAMLKVWRFFPRNLWNLVGRRQHLSNGRALIAGLRLTMQRRGIPLWLESPLDELVVEEGAVTGVLIRKDGKKFKIRARKGVVMAAGGFEHNAEMRGEYFKDSSAEWREGRYTSGAGGNTGDAIQAGARVGAALDLMDDMWWMPSTMPPGGRPVIVVFERGLPHMMIVNARGERFANEARPYNELGRILYESDAPPAYLIFDDTYKSKYTIGGMLPGVPPESYVRDGYVKRADSIEDLARSAGIDVQSLTQAVSRFNDMAARGEDEDYGKGNSAFDRYAGDPAHKPNPCLGPIGKPPFYAVEILAGDLGTKGGLLTNEHAQVVGGDGEVIPGLYAAGNNSACVMGEYYPGAGGTIGAGMTYGYIAAQHAAGAKLS